MITRTSFESQALSKVGVNQSQFKFNDRFDFEVDKIHEIKERIRKDLRRRRSSISKTDVGALSNSIAKNLLSLDTFISAKTIALYSTINKETDTSSIFLKSLESGKEVYFPRVSGRDLEFRRVKRPGDLVPGAFGVLEPDAQLAKIDAEQLDMVLVPGLAFDPTGKRLGYGKGYYDRALKDVDIRKRVGLAYGFQLVESLPSSDRDENVGIIVTDVGVIICEGGRTK